jgi:hypothetical protein
MKAVLNILSLGSPYNPKLLNDLSSVSDFSELQQQLYKPISDRYLTYCCYETKKTRLPGKPSVLIVPLSCASISGAADTTTLALPEDHSGISKFGSYSSESFQLLRVALTRLDESSVERTKRRWQESKGDGCLNVVVDVLK